MATKKHIERKPLETYSFTEITGLPLPGHWIQLHYDRWAFAKKIPIDYGAPRRFDLFKQIAEAVVPGWFEWNSWTNRIIDGLCHNQWVSLTGCSSSSKTHNAAGFSAVWWLCDPLDSSVLFCSTTSKMMRKRAWPIVQSFYTALGYNKFGHFVDSRMLWQAVKGDDKHSISGIAVQEGDTVKVADNIKGWHTKRQLVVIDEATSVPPGIFEACTNLYSSPQEFNLVMIANPRSRLDEHGKFSEPKDGWTSVSVDTEEWETTPKINGVTGICIRFDSEKSPNIVEGKVVSQHLPKKEVVEARKRAMNSENSPGYWSNDRGFWSPEGVTKTVFTETALIQFGAFDRHRFTGSNFIIIGALDPARLGDRPTLRFAALGDIEGGKMGLEWMDPIVLPLNMKVRRTLDFQLLDRCKEYCEEVRYRGQKYACAPANFGLDTTGGGADLADIFQEQWSPDIIRVGFNDAPSTDQASLTDIRPANEVYKNKRVEMYFRTKYGIQSGQIKGLDIAASKEMCRLEYEEKNGKLHLMGKPEYKKRFGESPDLADTAVICVEVARIKGFRLAAQGFTKERAVDFDNEIRVTQAVFETADYLESESDIESESINS